MTRSTSRPSLFSVLAVAVIGFAFGAPALTAFSQTNSKQQPASSTASSHADQSSQPQQQRGEVVFMANCARCHMPPSVIPPRITGTVVMHMRVRAKLSRADEQALLRFLAP